MQQFKTIVLAAILGATTANVAQSKQVVIGTPHLPYFCSANSKSTTGGDLAVTAVAAPTGEFQPGEEFSVTVTVKNNSDGCIADRGWQVFLESSNLTLGFVSVDLAIGKQAEREVQVTGLIPSNLSSGVNTLSVHARVSTDKFIDVEHDNDSSDPFGLNIYRRPQLVPFQYRQEWTTDPWAIHGAVWDYIIDVRNDGTRSSCAGTYELELWKERNSGGVPFLEYAWSSQDGVPSVATWQELGVLLHEDVSYPDCVSEDTYTYYVKVIQDRFSILEECIDTGLSLDGFGRYSHLYWVSAPDNLNNPWPGPPCYFP